MNSSKPKDTAPAESPCIKECKLAGNHCGSCGRHLDDIVGWRHYTDEQKREANKRAYQVMTGSEKTP
jgi:predicted Fe-S protein YdhL (DUF1289 family)